MTIVGKLSIYILVILIVQHMFVLSYHVKCYKSQVSWTRIDVTLQNKNKIFHDIKTKTYVGTNSHLEILSFMRSLEEVISSIESNSKSDSCIMLDESDHMKPLSELVSCHYEDDIDIKPLIDDINLLSSILGDVIKRESQQVYEIYEKFIKHALNRSVNRDVDAVGRMITCSMNITPEKCLGVVRAITETLNLINAAEVHHRIRLLRIADKLANRVTPLPEIMDSVGGTIKTILSDGHSIDEIYNSILKQRVDIVLTAHPTEVNRRTLLRKYRKVGEILEVLDRSDMTPYEQHDTILLLKREIASIWGSDEIRRLKPTPQQEAHGGIAIIESCLWDAVPQYLRKLDLQMQLSLNKTLPIDFTPIKFSSWIGGDRDGNPNVTPLVTYEVVITQRLQAAKLLLNDVVTLYKELAIYKGFSANVIKLSKSIKKSYDRRELYRRILGHVRSRLIATIEYCEEELFKLCAESPIESPGYYKSTLRTSLNSPCCDDNNYDIIIDNNLREIEKQFIGNIDEINAFEIIAGTPNYPFTNSKEVFHILSIIHDSLVSSGYSDVANGLLIDVIRRVNVFGLTLVPLDIRQESTRHKITIDAITKYLGIGSYSQWDEMTKINWLATELSGKRPLFNIEDMDNLFSNDLAVLDTLKTFQIISTINSESLGAYVISQAQSASDVLAVMLLQKQFGKFL